MGLPIRYPYMIEDLARIGRPGRRRRGRFGPAVFDFAPGPGSVYGCLARTSQAPLAQSAERLHGKEKVYGSIP